MHECECDELEALEEQFRLESLSDEEREAEAEEKKLRAEIAAFKEKVEKLVLEEVGERPDGLTHSSPVKNWRTKKSKAKARILEELKSEDPEQNLILAND
jgi:hypothetical protein